MYAQKAEAATAPDFTEMAAPKAFAGSVNGEVRRTLVTRELALNVAIRHIPIPYPSRVKHLVIRKYDFPYGSVLKAKPLSTGVFQVSLQSGPSAMNR